MALALVLLAGGCGVGATQPLEVQEEARRRGGGAEPFLVRDAEAAVAAHLAVEAGSLVLSSISIAPDHVSLVVADPHVPGNRDRYLYASGRLGDPSPVRTDGNTPDGFRLGDFHALERLPELVSRTVVGSGFSEPSVRSIRVEPGRKQGGVQVAGPRLEVNVSDPRRGSVSQRLLLAVGVLWLPGMALALPAVDWVRRH